MNCNIPFKTIFGREWDILWYLIIYTQKTNQVNLTHLGELTQFVNPTCLGELSHFTASLWVLCYSPCWVILENSGGFSRSISITDQILNIQYSIMWHLRKIPQIFWPEGSVWKSLIVQFCGFMGRVGQS